MVNIQRHFLRKTSISRGFSVLRAAHIAPLLVEHTFM